VEQQLFTLTINAVPADIPSALEADISELIIGGQVRVSDLVLPDGVTTDVEPESAVVIGQPPRVVVEEEVAAEGEAEEGAEEAAAAGAEPTGEAADTASEEG
jgi:large subunit ribosomal protein L25